MPMDNPTIPLGRGAPVVNINENVLFGDDTILDQQNILLGGQLSADFDATSNIVLSENVKLASGVKNVISIGVRNTRITKSNFTQIGSFLYHDAISKTLRLAKDSIVATENGSVQIGGKDGLTVYRREEGDDGSGSAGVDMVAPLKLSERGASGWQFDLAPSENDDGTFGPKMRDLVLRSDNGASIVFSDHYVPAVTNFTGQHRCIFRDDADGTPEPRSGTLLISTGAYRGLDGEDVTVDESVPVVTVSSRARDQRVFGVLSSVESVGGVRRVQVGNLAFERPKAYHERRVVVNGSGEGGILVCGEGGDISNGDYLCSSSLPGIAMRQAETYKCCFTCAKATGSVAFQRSGGGDDRAITMVGCVYA